MALSRDKLRRQLSAIEPTERMYEGLDTDDVPALRDLLLDEEGWLAARAVYALARVESRDANAALNDAARSERPEVRVAVAANADRMRVELSDKLLISLLDDGDPGVRKFAIRAVSDRNGNDVRARVNEIALQDSDATLRTIAAEVSSASPTRTVAKKSPAKKSPAKKSSAK
jgi:HEAT repeat protein